MRDKWDGPFSLVFKSGLDAADIRMNWPSIYIVMNQLPKDNEGRVMVSTEERSVGELKSEVAALKRNLDDIVTAAERLSAQKNSN